MLKRIAARWWLPLICVLVVTFLAVVSVSYINYTTQPMFVGRTTVMELPEARTKDQTRNLETSMGNLANLARSQRVLSNAASTLNDLGMKYSPEQILGATSIEPVKDTSILAIEVTLPDAKEAKVAADVITAAFKQEYARFYKKQPGRGDELTLKTLDPAFVHQVDRHPGLKILTALVLGPFTGAILGLILAAAIPIKNKESSFAN